MTVRVVRSTVIDAPAEEVWRLLRDFNSHVAWHPAIARSNIEGEEPGDLVGAVRAFTLRDGGFLREQLIALSDSERSLTYCLLEAPVRLDGYVATMSLLPVTDGDGTFLRWSCRFNPPRGQESALALLVGETIYDAGLLALRTRFGDGIRLSEPRSRQPALAVSRQRPPLVSDAGSTATVRCEAIVVEAYGGPDVLVPRIVEVPAPGRGEVRLRQEAIGVNYIDVHCRDGSFDLMPLPGIPGMEAAGVVADIGPGVEHLAVGDRVVYASARTGAYSGFRTIEAASVVRLPPDVPERTAAGIFLKGIMADILARDVHPAKAGEVALVRAAAGGVGLLLSAMLRSMGASVIGVVSKEEKATAARKAGCDHVVVGSETELARAIPSLTGGRGVDVVFDGLGRETFEPSLDLLALRGHLVSFGQTTGPVGELNVDRLAAKSVRLSRPNISHYLGKTEEVEARASRIFAGLRAGALDAAIGAALPLRDAREAHRALEARRTIGALILIPEH